MNDEEECDVKSPSDRTDGSTVFFCACAPLSLHSLSLSSSRSLPGFHLFRINIYSECISWFCIACGHLFFSDCVIVVGRSTGDVVWKRRKKWFPINWLMKRGWHFPVNILFCVLCRCVYICRRHVSLFELLFTTSKYTRARSHTHTQTNSSYSNSKSYRLYLHRATSEYHMTFEAVLLIY